MSPWWIWGAAAVLYGVFTLWYNNWRGPLAKEEVATYMARLEKNPQVEPERLDAVRRFLESDDGGEFYMFNVISTFREPVEMPGTGEKKPAREVLEKYTSYFMGELFRRAGHPAFAGPAAGGVVEEWGIDNNPDWTFGGVIRYRSRRDMAELATDPRFEPAHAYKIAAMAHTFAFPVKAELFVGPRVWIGLGIALAAALTQLAVRAAR
ncbi:MAG TPA: hypothetical protein VNF72_02690 [Myxococcota bacterium]|nr:hypothetical protein [Myxococcota bacterium]